jgi:hypothetical protein
MDERGKCLDDKPVVHCCAIVSLFKDGFKGRVPVQSLTVPEAIT